MNVSLLEVEAQARKMLVEIESSIIQKLTDLMDDTLASATLEGIP